MSTNYPTSLDALSNPSAGDSVTGHAALHTNVNDAIEALQAKIGITNSLVSTSLEYILKNSGSVSPGHKHVAADITDLPTAVKATGSVYGNTRLTEDPASASTPIAVGVNTSLSGTAISTGNKAVDAASVSNAGASGKIVQLAATKYPAADGSDITNISALDVSETLTAGETISAGQPVCLLPYNSNVPTYDQSVQASGTGSPITSSPITVANQSNRVILVHVVVTNANLGYTVSGVTFGGAAMTLLKSLTPGGSNDAIYTYFLAAPSTSASNLVISTSNASTAVTYSLYSYYNVSQSTPTNITSYSVNSTGSLSITPTQSQDLVNAVIGIATSARTDLGSHSLGTTPNTSDTASAVLPVPQNISFTYSGSGYVNAIMVVLSAVTQTALRAYKTSATSIISIANYKGIAATAGTAGNSFKVKTLGQDANQSGMTLGAIYLSDTEGALTSTPGTYTKQVGSAVSATTLDLAVGASGDYIGSQVLAVGANTITPAFQALWKTCILDINATTSSGYAGELTLKKTGRTSGSVVTTEGGAPSFYDGSSASVSGATITITRLGNANVTPTYTAYFYL